MAEANRIDDKKLLVRRMTSHARLPEHGTGLAAGLDLYSAYNYIIARKSNILVKTDIQVQFPSGVYGRVSSRSGW